MFLLSSIPALMYHHVNRHAEDSLTISPENFERQIRFLADNGYTALSLREFFLEKARINKHSRRPVLLSFDDGFVDNWIYAYPILKKYGMKAAIFIITDLVRHSAKLRPTLDDVREGRLKEADLPAIKPHVETKRANIYAKDGLDDYATWEELREMESSGLIDVQPHTARHSAYFSGESILSYNDGSFLKMGFATDGDLRLGIPVYKVSPAMVARRYFDDRSLRDRLASFAERNGGPALFARPDWKKLLSGEARAYIKEAGGLKGHFETMDQQRERIGDELKACKATTEKELNKECDYICWPWGSVNGLAKKLAVKAGYRGGIGMKAGRNTIFTDAFNIRRFNPCGKDITTFDRLLRKYS